MTVEEAVKAARANLPVIYESPMLGPQLYARIGAIRKDFAIRSDVERGKPAEVYALELFPMNGANSSIVVKPELVREAKPGEIADIGQYRHFAPMPPVRPELICEEVRKGHYNGKV